MKIIRFLGSLPVAIALLSILTLLFIVSTVTESIYGTPFAQDLVYKAGWFDILLSLVGVNILCSTIRKIPWKRRHTGFVITHIGILLILGGSLLTRLSGIDGELAIAEGERRHKLPREGYQISVTLPDRQPITALLDPKEKTPSRQIPLPDGAGNLAIDEFLPNAVTSLDIEEGKNESTVNHAIQFTLSSDAININQTIWLIESDPQNPHPNMLSFGPAFLALKSGAIPLPGEESMDKKSPSLIFSVTSDHQWKYRITASNNEPKEGALATGAVIETGWKDFSLRIDKVINHAKLSRTYEPSPHGKGGEIALCLAYTAPDGKKEISWLSENGSTKFNAGNQTIEAALTANFHPLPFILELKDFRKIDYPGTSTPKSYESDVVLYDPENKTVIQKTISMNNPLDYAGYRIFQSSYIQDPESGEVSIFTVSSAPGTTYIYIGAIVMFAGMITLFYIKPLTKEGEKKNG